MKTSFLTQRAASKYASALLKMGHRITFMRKNGEYFVGVVAK